MKKNHLVRIFCSLIFSSLISAQFLVFTYYSSSMSEITNINQKNSILQTNTMNDIISAKITCYLHLKTTQIQLDINFLGTNSLELNNKFYTTLEEISVYGEIRSVYVVESDTIVLNHIEEVIGNSTKIQFTLSSYIPIGFVRNVKITYIQDTADFLTNYNYELGVNWLRLIGNQNIIIICDYGISLLNCQPLPHSISIVNNKLVLNWLEVNCNNFYANMNYSSLAIIDDLDISPADWNFGRIRKDSEPIVKVFAITNNENQKLDGIIIKPDWIETNFTNWELNIGETMYLKVTIDRVVTNNYNGNITLQCSIASFPINIEISGKVAEISTGSILTIILLLTIFGASAGIIFLIGNSNRKKLIKPALKQKEVVVRIDFDKWREILTDREYTIFKIIANNSELSQAEIVRQTTLSKSTVSRAVGRLEAKGLIKKDRYGMSNIVTLNTEFFTKKNN